MCKNTTPNDIFGPLLKYMEKKTKNEMQPIGGKNLLLFLDDLDLKENSELAEPLRFFKENHTWIYQNELKYFDKVMFPLEKVVCISTDKSQVSLIGTECLSAEGRRARPTRSRKCFHYFYVDQVSHMRFRKN